MEEVTCAELKKVFKHLGHTPGMKRPLWHVTQIIKRDMKHTVNKITVITKCIFFHTQTALTDTKKS